MKRLACCQHHSARDVIGFTRRKNVELLTLIKCAQQLGFKLKELQGILHGSQDDARLWERATQAIAIKQHELTAQIAELQKMQAGLLELEAMTQCTETLQGRVLR